MLRDVRDAAGSPPYRVLGRTSGYSAATLSKAAAGRNLPRLEVALAFVTACGGDRSQMRLCWIDAYAEIRGVVPPKPERVATLSEFAAALDSLMRLSGYQSQHTMAYAAKRRSIHLSRSTLCRILSGRRLPSAATLEAFLEACGLPGPDMAPWHHARRRLAPDRPATDRVATDRVATDRLGDPAVATPEVPTNLDATLALYDELCVLRKGRGLWAVPLRVGPILRELSDLGPDDPPPLVRAKVTAAASGLPPGLAGVAAAGFALGMASRGRLLENRLTDVAARMGRDRRTVRRRLNAAQRLMVNQLLCGPGPTRTGQGRRQ